MIAGDVGGFRLYGRLSVRVLAAAAGEVRAAGGGVLIRRGAGAPRGGLGRRPPEIRPPRSPMTDALHRMAQAGAGRRFAALLREVRVGGNRLLRAGSSMIASAKGSGVSRHG